MAHYKATVTFKFDDEDLVNAGYINGEDSNDILFGELQNFPIGSPWVGQILKDDKPTIDNLSRYWTKGTK